MSRANEPAFPRPFSEYSADACARGAFSEMRPGLTIREHFAGLAMQGLIAVYHGREEIVQAAVQMADALIAELDKGSK